MTTDTDAPPYAAKPLKREPHWPAGVYTMSLESLDHLGVDRDGLLYWDGRLLKLSRKITLDTQERLLAWIVAGATVVSAAATVVQAYAALFPTKGP